MIRWRCRYSDFYAVSFLIMANPSGGRSVFLIGLSWYKSTLKQQQFVTSSIEVKYVVVVLARLLKLRMMQIRPNIGRPFRAIRTSLLSCVKWILSPTESGGCSKCRISPRRPLPFVVLCVLFRMECTGVIQTVEKRQIVLIATQHDLVQVNDAVD